MVSPCGFESHLSHQKTGYPSGVTGFFAEMGLERPSIKHASGMFLGRGRVPQISDASHWDVDEICEKAPKNRLPFWGDRFFCGDGTRKAVIKHAGGMFLGRGRVPQISDASHWDVDEICKKAPKNRLPFWGDRFFGARDGTRKAVIKTCRWHVFRPWESPADFRRIPQGC